MNILAFESSCDETAAAVVADGRLALSGSVSSQVDLHSKYGGVVPEIAARRHTEVISFLAETALDDAGIRRGDVDAVAVTAAPGLIGALLVGVGFAKAAAFALGVPLIPVHHVRAHVAACYLSPGGWEPPFLALVVSGGHTILLGVQDYTQYTIIASTRDDAAGEGFDKTARVLGLGYPGGAEIDRLAAYGNPAAFVLPSCVLPDGDFSFSGLKTAVLQIVNRSRMRKETLSSADMAASFTSAVCKPLVERTMEAAESLGYGRICLTGGVAANSHLRSALRAAAQRRGFDFCVPPTDLCGDNAKMVGAQAFYEFLSGHAADSRLNASATWSPEKALC